MKLPSVSILGCGWLGYPLACQMVKKGYQIKGSSTTEKKLQQLSNCGIIPFRLSLEKQNEDLRHFLDSDILLIAVPPQELSIMQNLLQKVEASSISKVIFISSTSVYHNNNATVTEESETKTDSSLFQAEELFRKSSNFATTIVRFGGLFGYDRKPVNFIRSGKIMQNPEGYVNLIHQDDCITILIKIIQNNVWGETLNACADTHPQRKLFYETQARNHKRTLPIFNTSKPASYKIVANEKVKQLLNYHFQHNDLLTYED